MEDFIAIEDDEDLVELPTDWATLFNKSKKLNFLQKDDSSKLLPLTPWKNWNEFEYVYYNLFNHFYKCNEMQQETQKHLKSKDESLLNLEHSYNIIEMWRSRNFNNIPICIDISQQLLHLLYLFNGNTQNMRRLFAISISRLTNRLTDPKYNKPILFWSKQMSFPIQIISIRHDIIHGNLPSIYTLKQHSILLLKWLDINYWQYQINKINNISNTILMRKMLKLKSKNVLKTKDIEDTMYYLRHNLCHNKISIMKYFIPCFIEQCLIDITCVNNEKLDKKNIIQQLFTVLFVKYNSFMQRLFGHNASLIAYFVINLLQKRYKFINSKQIQTNMENIKCNLMIIWSSTLLMDNDNKKYWKRAFDKCELIFIFKNILKFVMCFNDYWSKEIVKNIKKMSKQFHIQNDIIILKSINSIQSYVSPLMRDIKSDESINSLIKQRLDAQELDNKLMCGDIEINENSDENKSDEDDSDDAMDDDVGNDENNEKEIQCKWKKTNECKFLPIGHSVLPPL